MAKLINKAAYCQMRSNSDKKLRSIKQVIIRREAEVSTDKVPVKISAKKS